MLIAAIQKRAVRGFSCMARTTVSRFQRHHAASLKAPHRCFARSNLLAGPRRPDSCRKWIQCHTSACHSLYHSWRRDKDSAGRMISYVRAI